MTCSPITIIVLLLIICFISIVLNVAKNLCKSMTASSILITISLLYTCYIITFSLIQPYNYNTGRSRCILRSEQNKKKKIKKKFNKILTVQYLTLRGHPAFWLPDA